METTLITEKTKSLLSLVEFIMSIVQLTSVHAVVHHVVLTLFALRCTEYPVQLEACNLLS